MSSHGGANRRLSGIPRPSSRLSQGSRPPSALGHRPASSMGAAKNQGTPILKSFMDVGYQATLGTRTFSIKDAPAWKSTFAGGGLSVASGIHSFSHLDAAYLGTDGIDPSLSLWDGVLIKALKRAITNRSNLLVHLSGPAHAGQEELGDNIITRARTAFQARSDLGSCLMRVVEIQGKLSARGNVVTEAATCSLPEGKRGECKVLGHAAARQLDSWVEVSKMASRAGQEPMDAGQRVVQMELHFAQTEYLPISIFLIYNVENKSSAPSGDANGRWARTRTSSVNESMVNPLRQAEAIHIPKVAHPDVAPGMIIRKMIRPHCAGKTNVVNVICRGRSADQVPQTASCLRAVQLAREAALLSLPPTGGVPGRQQIDSVLESTFRFQSLEKENLGLQNRVKELSSQQSATQKSLEDLEKRMNLMGGTLESQIATMQEELSSEVEHGELMMDLIMQCQTFIARFETLNLPALRDLFADVDHSIIDVSTNVSDEVEDQYATSDASHTDSVASQEVLESRLSAVPDDTTLSLSAGALLDARIVRFSPTETSTPARTGPVSRDTPYTRQGLSSQLADSDDSSSAYSLLAESPASFSQVPDPVPRIPTPPTLPKPGWEKRLREGQKAEERDSAQGHYSRVGE